MEELEKLKKQVQMKAQENPELLEELKKIEEKIKKLKETKKRILEKAKKERKKAEEILKTLTYCYFALPKFAANMEEEKEKLKGLIKCLTLKLCARSKQANKCLAKKIDIAKRHIGETELSEAKIIIKLLDTLSRVAAAARPLGGEEGKEL